MKIKRFFSFGILVVAVFSLFTACKMGFEKLDDVDVDGGKAVVANARVTLTLPARTRAHSPIIPTAAGERAVGYVDRVVLTALDDSNAVLASAKADFAGDEMTKEVGIDIPAGVAVRIKADVYNLSMDGESPMVSGISEPVTIGAGEQASVVVLCLPVAPIVIGSEPKELSIGTDVYNGELEKEFHSTDEKWLKVTADPERPMHIFFNTDTLAALPLDSNLDLCFSAYDGSGKTLYLTSPQQTATGFKLTINAQRDETIYLYPYFTLETWDPAINASFETLCSVSTEILDLRSDDMEQNNSKDYAAWILSGDFNSLTLLDDDWFMFRIEEYSTLTLICQSEGEPLFAQIVMPDGSVLNDFTSGIVDQQGTYFIHLYGGSGPCAYELGIIVEPGTDDPFGNDSVPNARNLADVTAQDTYVIGGTADWFELILDEPSLLKLTPSFINAKSNERYGITLYDSFLNVIAESGTSGTTWSPPPGVSESLLAGIYFVKIEAFVGHPSYQLSTAITSLGVVYTDSLEPNETAATAKVLPNCGNSLGTSTDWLWLPDDDWFSYNGVAAGYLFINFSVVPAMAPEVTIYDSDNNEVYSNVLPQYEYIEFDFTAGEQYTIRVRPIWKDGEGIVNSVVRYQLSLY